MAHQTIVEAGLIYTVSLDAQLPRGRRPWAVLRALLFDEITGQPPRGGVAIESPLRSLSPRAAEGGLVGFVEIPASVFPLLGTTPYTVDIVLRADGYLPESRSVTIPAIPGFPTAYAPRDLGAVLLHRSPTVILGRVAVDNGLALQGVPGATVTLTGLWRTPPPANLNVPADPPEIVSVAPGLYFTRPAGAQAQGLDFQGAPGPDKILLEEAQSDQAVLQLSDRSQIAPGDVLAIDAADPALTEYMTIQTVAGAGTDDQPATITLSSPLRGIHRRGAVVHGVQFQNVGVATQLSADAIAGDVCLFLSAVINLTAAPLLSLHNVGIPDEYHAASYFTATTDADGFFRLPPLSRVAQCTLRAHDGGRPDLNVVHAPDYSSEASRLEFVYH